MKLQGTSSSDLRNELCKRPGEELLPPKPKRARSARFSALQENVFQSQVKAEQLFYREITANSEARLIGEGNLDFQEMEQWNVHELSFEHLLQEKRAGDLRAKYKEAHELFVCHRIDSKAEELLPGRYRCRSLGMNQGCGADRNHAVPFSDGVCDFELDSQGSKVIYEFVPLQPDAIEVNSWHALHSHSS